MLKYIEISLNNYFFNSYKKHSFIRTYLTLDIRADRARSGKDLVYERSFTGRSVSYIFMVMAR